MVSGHIPFFVVFCYLFGAWKQKTMSMKINLRRKKIRDGKGYSLYLDISPPPPGRSRYEFLELCVFVDPHTPQQRQQTGLWLPVICLCCLNRYGL